MRRAAGDAGISHCSVLDWVRDDPELANQYARARQAGLQARADTLMDTAWDPGIEPARLRIIVDAQKWELSKLLPKVYGDKLEMEHKGGLTVTLQSGDEAL